MTPRDFPNPPPSPRPFIYRIILPTLLCGALFAFAMFLVILPAVERSILDRKREMIRELTTSAWNILASLEAQERQGAMTREQAQASAIAQVKALHYGMEMKDYFWINDLHPRMVVHPYRHDLNGKDLSDYRDPTGKRVFVEMVELVRRQGEGYVEYQWQWKDDATHIVPKISYVKGFTPWGWVLGTGVYVDDVQRDVRRITGRLAAWSLAILAGMSLLLFVIARQSWITERRRRAAEAALQRSYDHLSTEADDLRAREVRNQAALEDLRLTLAMLEPTLARFEDFRLIDDLRRAESVEQVVERNAALPRVVRALVEQGARPALVNRLITLNADAVIESLVRLNVAKLGPPPAPFVFLIMGSEGRREQTLKTDQDNALLYADGSGDDASAAAKVHDYFLQLGRQVCEQLQRAGYAACEGGVMASNPKWVMPLSQWRRAFGDWIRASEAQDLLQTKIFFDFRAGPGEASLVADLRRSLRTDFHANPAFFGLLARNVLLFAPPIGVFGQFHLEPTPDGRRALNIKSAMIPIVDFARLYALRHGIDATNTTERLEALRDAGILAPQQAAEVLEVYAALMQIRLQHQVRRLAAGLPPDNFIEPAHLSYLDQRLLKDSFHQVRHFQTRLSYDFTGLPEAPA